MARQTMSCSGKLRHARVTVNYKHSLWLQSVVRRRSYGPIVIAAGEIMADELVGDLSHHLLALHTISFSINRRR